MVQKIVFLILAIYADALFAAENFSLRMAVEYAASNNPAVQATWSAFQASDKGVRAAKGGYYPKLDFIAELGSERTEDPQDAKNSYSTSSSRITLTQMLFDGFATKQEVAKQNYIKLARYYEFRQASEEMALETSQAYLDILRYRELVKLARENHAQHRRYFSDIEKRVRSGVGRGVDLEQARARLALAESNVLTETTNLHDVSIRFQRLVGKFPAENMPTPSVPKTALPSKPQDALLQAFASSPQLNAAIENIRVARADLRGKKASMVPRVDLRLRKQVDENDRGIEGQYNEEAIELVMTYNLYNGGSDRARKRQSNYLFYEAQHNRERVCREVKQTVSIAYNDISSKTQLVGYLARNEKAISKARKAYKNQFYIGQRTLLDLLDTENEYFEVKRTITNARSELILAEFRTLAGMGLLLRSMDVEGLDRDRLDKLDLSRDKKLNARCPVEAPKMESLDLDIVNDTNEFIVVPGKRNVMHLDIKFKNQSAELSQNTGPDMVKAAQFLCNHPNIRGEVEGHTDSIGSEAYNLKLSQARAESVRNQLVLLCSTTNGRLTSIGHGELRPIAGNDTDEGRATNRRVELVLEVISKGYTTETLGSVDKQ